jgi:SSS family solute:Na+ symporter
VTPVAIIIAYLVLVTTLGSLLARRVRTSRHWTVAGGGMGVLMLSVGLAGTRIGGAGTYGVAGNVASGGIWYLWWYAVATFLALAFVGIFFAKPYRRLGLQTVGEAFWIRDHSRRNQVLTSLCVQTEFFVVDVIEAYVIALMLHALTGISMLAGVLIAAVILVSYTTLGGLWGTAVTNLVHSAMIVVGLLAVGVLGLRHLGGWQAMSALIDRRLLEAGAEAAVDSATWWSPVGAGAIPIIGMILSAAIHTPAASIYTNFSTAAKSQRILLRGFLLGGAFAALMPLLAGLVGMQTLAACGLDRGLQGYHNITTMALEISPWVGGLALAAILAAVISSGGPVLLASATMFVRDWLPVGRSGDGSGLLRAYRLTTIAYGLVAALVAYGVSRTQISLLDLLLLGYAMVVPPAIALGYLFFWKRTTEEGAFWGMAAGYVLGVVWYVWTRLGGSTLDTSYVTTLVPLVVVPAISLTPAGAGRRRRARADREIDHERFYATLAGAPADEAPVASE